MTMTDKETNTEYEKRVYDHADLEKPVFVVGALRSGTTMLRLMLDAHPEVCVFGEFEYAVKYARGGEFPAAPLYSQLLDTDRVFQTHGFEFLASESYEDVVKSFLRQAASRGGKPIIGATVHSRFDLIRKIWPQARFIHLCRDPRDVSRSCIGMGWVGNVWYGADYWLDAEQRWESLKPSLGKDDYLEMNYETLVVSPEEELRRACAFLGIPYSSQMMSYAEDSTYKSPDARLVNQWKTKLSTAEIGFVEAKCCELMERRGYTCQTDGAWPSTLARTKLRVGNSVARKTFNLRRYGLPLYIKWQIAKLLHANQGEWAKGVLKEKYKVDTANLR